MKKPATSAGVFVWRVSRLVFCVILPCPFAYTQCGIGANNNNICIGINIAVGAMVMPFVHKVRLAPNLASGVVLRRSDANKMNVHYVMPSKRVARIGASICAADLTRMFDCNAVKIPLPRFLTILFLQ